MTTTNESTLDVEALRKGLPEGPWSVEDDASYWLVQAPDDEGGEFPIAEGIFTEATARAIAAIPDMLTEIQRLRNENSNLEASCKIEWTRREQAEAMLSEILPRLCVCDCEPVSGCADAILREKVRSFLAKTETEQ